MLWSPNEVLAYLKDEISAQNNVTDKGEIVKFSKTSSFGGFPVCVLPEQDFVFIAENSEIYGPNPLFTIPCQPKDLDLNFLSTRILSADYQGLSSKNVVSLKHAQLLMPDISKDIHAAVNYFVLFDNEARGFIRPTCIAYITSNKYKLICYADSILNMLSEASTMLQHGNMPKIIQDLKAMLLEVSQVTNDDNTNAQSIQSKIAESASKDIQDVIDVIEASEGNDLIDKHISTVVTNLKKISFFSEVCKQIYNFSTCNLQSQRWENKQKHGPQKSMRSLYSICGNGSILGLYHLYIMHKHFRRKCENIYMTKHFGHVKRNEKKLYFGACIKAFDVDNSSFTGKQCILSDKRISRVPSLDNEKYFIYLDSAFEKVLLDFLNRENNSFCDLEQNSSFYQSSDSSMNSTGPDSVNSSTSGYLSSVGEEVDGFNGRGCGHIVSLECIWDILEDMQKENSGIEAAFLEILKLFDDTEKLLFSLLTRTPVVLISTPEESAIAQNFMKALSVFIPRKKNEMLLVELNRQQPLSIEYFRHVAAVNIPLHQDKAVDEIVPNHLWHSLCILNLRDCSLNAPAYMGVLLKNVNEKFRILPLEGPAFPITVGILSDIQSVLEWWHMVTLPSVNESAAQTSILSKGFSKLDVQILLKLTQLCRS